MPTLFEMVTGPAARAGLVFDEGLPTRILDDMGTETGTLALLAFALHELYEARASGQKLTTKAYKLFGGVRQAIGKRAEDTFEKLPATSQKLLNNVFRELVDVNELGQSTRRRVGFARIAATDDMRTLTQAFVAKS